MKCGVAAAAAMVALGASGCTDAITLEIASNRPIPTAIDSVCVGVADESLSGGHFGQFYRLQDKLATLPQTLRVEAGNASHALAWARADRGGVPVAYASTRLDFARDTTLLLDKCQVGPSPAPAVRGNAVGPGNALVAASHGQGGTLIVAVGAAGESTVLALQTGQLAMAATVAPALPPGKPIAITAADVDSDCDDDILIATDGAAPVVWLRDGAQFTAGMSIGDVTVSALAAADVDQDGDTDVVTGGGNRLELFRNDGSGNLAASPGLAAGSRATAISALALGDLDGDGNPDLVVGQAGAPLVAWLGSLADFTPADGVVPAVPLDVKRLVIGDADYDFDPDVAAIVDAAPMRLYIDRDGRLEDQSFVRLPQPAPMANAIAFGGWDAGCGPDAVIVADAGATSLHGIDGGAFEIETATPAAHDVVMTDLDDDGDLDAILATAEGVQWFAR